MLQQEIKDFVGWVILVVGTWFLAISIRQMLVDFLYLGMAGELVTIAFGLALIIVSITLFGRKKPW